MTRYSSLWLLEGPSRLCSNSSREVVSYSQDQVVLNLEVIPIA